MSPCHDLVRFADGELDFGRAAAFRDHLRACEPCREGLMAAMQLRAQLSTLPPGRIRRVPGVAPRGLYREDGTPRRRFDPTVRLCGHPVALTAGPSANGTHHERELWRLVKNKASGSSFHSHATQRFTPRDHHRGRRPHQLPGMIAKYLIPGLCPRAGGTE